MEKTLLIIKPDVVARNKIGEILSEVESQGFVILGLKHLILSPQEAELFYEVHREKDFFPGLIEYMTSGPVVACCLSGDDAVHKLRDIVGDTDPRKAGDSSRTLRRKFRAKRSTCL